MQTARLRLERPRPEHVAGLARVLAEPGVGAWLWPGRLGGPRSPAQTAAIVERDARLWAREGWGPWIAGDRRTGEVLGRVGLARNRIEGRPAIELAWLLTERRWGEGLASEAAAEAARCAFEEAGLERVVAIARLDNPASHGVMRRTGMTFLGEIEHAGLPHVLAELTASAWRRARDAPPR